MKINRELYIKSPKSGYAVILGVSYVGSGLRRRETLCYECEGRDDLPFTPKERFSEDNGRTWSKWMDQSEFVKHEVNHWDLFGIASIYHDEVTGLDLGAGLRQTIVEKPTPRWYNHTYWAISSDGGTTWPNPVQFRYEDGAYRDPANPLDLNYLTCNRAYPGGSTVCRDGKIILACTAVNVPDDAPDTDPTGELAGWDKAPHARDIALACFVGRWDSVQRTCVWSMSNRVWVPLLVSCRGLMEAMPVELSDGRILVVCRGSNTTVTPGRKWYSLSRDGGKTLSEIAEFKYDDGGQFYSPSSIHGFIRHSQTNKLYWVANICKDPPDANNPRYPLVIAEIDERIPAVKRETVAVIDDRAPGEGKALALSNFTLFENRETHRFEMYMSRYSAHSDAQDPKSYDADGYKYMIDVE